MRFIELISEAPTNGATGFVSYKCQPLPGSSLELCHCLNHHSNSYFKFQNNKEWSENETELLNDILNLKAFKYKYIQTQNSIRLRSN